MHKHRDVHAPVPPEHCALTMDYDLPLWHH